MLAELISHVIVGIVRVVDAVVDGVGLFFAMERKMKEGSRMGESPQEAKSRRWWQRLEDRWFVIAFVLLVIALLLGVAVQWW